MRIIVVGGAGTMGRRTVEDLSGSSGISSITIADIDEKAAAKLASGLSGAPVEMKSLRLDAFDHGNLVEAIRDHDLVVSSIGPYHVFEDRMVRAVLEAGRDYISICDEWDVVDSIVNDFNEEAKERNVKIICGMGASPGVTNMAAIHLCSELDRVTGIDISVFLPLDTGAGAAAIEHGVYIMSGKMAVWRNGRRQMLRPCTESCRKDFPGAGKRLVWNMGHSEPVTLPAVLESKGLQNVNFYMGFGNGDFLLTGPARMGWYEVPALRKLLTASFISIEKVLSLKEAKNGVSRIDVMGNVNGEDRQLTAFGSATMQDSTALALSVGALMMAGGSLLRKGGGVYSPEAIFDSKACLSMLHDKGIRVYRDAGLTEPILR